MLRIPRQTATDDPGTASSSATPSSSASASDSSSAASSTPSGSSSAPSTVSPKPPTSKPTIPPTSVPPTSTPNTNSTISQSQSASSSTSQGVSTDSPAPQPQSTPPPNNSNPNSDGSSPFFLAPNSTTIPTANLTTIVTMINGQSTTFTSILPTNLATGSPSSSGGSHRTAIIAGTTAAAGGLLICALVLVFVVRKVQVRKAIADALKNQGAKREGRGLLEDEGFDDDNGHPPMRGAYGTYSSLGAVSATAGSVARAGSPVPSHIKSRTSETGSIFREEVWPPPGFVDPISKQSSQVDLSRIVDEVMGPGTTVLPSASSTSLNSGGHSRGPTDATTTSGHTSSYSHGSVNSKMGLLPPSTTSFSDPFASSSNQGSVYYPSSHPHVGAISAPGQLPPGALPPTVPGLGVTSASPPTALQSSSNNSAATQPKKSSPLARALSKDARILTGGRP
ncbi:hypothetical protein D9619_009424 [Psilocybe cf. subviscida]|uniref:Mid2 domain-containing protein n=1 Tax=Psilocybe cf. subviscida TaxID=2480587 RepID=A0A8H5FAB6_9AGAR|nr:hypothetical protein D9619_009424 [Psilocybe cf. subviscida]